VEAGNGPRDARYQALGQVTEEAALLEIALRMTFRALAGGPYAALMAAGQETHWLLETCEIIADHHHDLDLSQRRAIRDALQDCRHANRDRNRLVHDAWGTGADGAPAVIRSARRSYAIAGRPWTEAQIRAVVQAIVAARQGLLTAVEDGLGPDRLTAGP
jgi:hypothetical protein